MFDPEVAGVIGLVRPEAPRQALVIVYVDGEDFEVSEEMERLL